MVQASPLSVLYTIHYTKRHSVCLGPDSKDRGVDLRAVVLIANMPRSIGWRERGGGEIWLLNTGGEENLKYDPEHGTLPLRRTFFDWWI